VRREGSMATTESEGRERLERTTRARGCEMSSKPQCTQQQDIKPSFSYYFFVK